MYTYVACKSSHLPTFPAGIPHYSPQPQAYTCAECMSNRLMADSMAACHLRLPECMCVARMSFPHPADLTVVARRLRPQAGSCAAYTVRWGCHHLALQGWLHVLVARKAEAVAASAVPAAVVLALAAPVEVAPAGTAEAHW